MSFPHRRGVQLALILLAAASLAACASRPKPMGPAPVAEAPPPPPATQAAPPPAPVDEGQMSGVPVPGSVRDFVINAGDLVYFDFDRYVVRDDSRSVLDAQAGWLNRYPAVHIRIEGNCDEKGTREYNFALGARRANAVREYLVGRGISAARIETISYGKERPIAGNDNEDGEAKNRNARTVITQGAR